jgi:acyl-CoA synthetase (AMP-forming)/AMP-acid ligase II
MNIAATLSKARRLFPDKEAVVDGDRRLTYRQLAERVDRLAAGLAAIGLSSQDCISIVAPNSLEFLETYYAAAVLGLMVNPINVRLLGPEMAFILNDARARLVIADPRYKGPVIKALEEAESVEGVIWLTDAPPELTKGRSWAYEAFLNEGRADFSPPAPLGDEATAHLYYTSGTTGRPKGVILTHRNVTAHALAAIAEFNLNDTDVWYHVAPMFHLADAWATFALTWVGGRHVMQPEFEAGKVLATIEREGITLTNLIPTMLNLMVNHDQAENFNYSSLKVILSGGAPIAPETVRRIISTFDCDYIQTYGLTETSPYCTVSTLKAHLKKLPLEKQREIISRTGREFMAVELRVVDEDGRDVPRDDRSVGEIWVRGDTVTPGYLNRPKANEDAFKDGWFKTGDLAVMDEEGYVNIVDRKKDIIISGGENVFSTEVEYTLMEHPSVLECVVIGVPDPKWGEAIKAVVVRKTGKEAEEAELISFVKERLAHYKAPKSVDFVDELPKTGSGKLMKRTVREWYWKSEERRVH